MRALGAACKRERKSRPRVRNSQCASSGDCERFRGLSPRRDRQAGESWCTAASTCD